MKDVVGSIIEVGATVALARRSGNSAEMVIRKVITLEDKGYSQSVQVEAPSGRKGWTSPKNLVVISKGT